MPPRPASTVPHPAERPAIFGVTPRAVTGGDTPVNLEMTWGNGRSAGSTIPVPTTKGPSMSGLEELLGGGGGGGPGGMLGRLRSSSGGGLGSMLGCGSGSGGGSSPRGTVTSMLDQNEDGSVVDDLTRMATGGGSKRGSSAGAGELLSKLMGMLRRK